MNNQRSSANLALEKIQSQEIIITFQRGFDIQFLLVRLVEEQVGNQRAHWLAPQIQSAERVRRASQVQHCVPMVLHGIRGDN